MNRRSFIQSLGVGVLTVAAINLLPSTQEKQKLQEVWCYDTRTCEWKQTYVSQLPENGRTFVMTSNKKMFIFGGQQKTKVTLHIPRGIEA
jgi:hypothetical protein